MTRFVLLLLFAAACAANPARPGSDAEMPIDTSVPVDTGRPAADTGTRDTGSSRDAGDAGNTWDAGDGGNGDAGDGGNGDAGDAGDTGVDGGLPSGQLRVLSLNLHCLETDGTAFGTNGARFAAIASRAASAGTRVLLLQEVCDDGTVNALTDLEAALETETGRPWHGAFAFAHIAWAGTPEEASEGVAILADVPLLDSQVLEHGAMGSLRRVMLSAGLGGDLLGLWVGAFHLDHANDAVRQLQAGELAAAGLLHGGSANVILGGDLNDREGSSPYRVLVGAGYIDASSPLRSTRIDHIFVHRGALVRAASAELLFDSPSDRVSDHPGVLVHFDAVTATPTELTTIEIDIDVGVGNAIFVRGNQAPLSWTEGWPAINAGPSLWRFATTELSGVFEYKALRNNLDWSTGANYSGTAGVTNRAIVTGFD